MKRTLLAGLLSLSALVCAKADLIWYEGFNYVDGPTVAVGTNANGTTNWFHTGSATTADSLIHNSKLEISATGGTLSRAEDVNRKIATAADSPYTNLVSTPLIFSSFTVNSTNFPNAAGTYFAHFNINDTTFRARIFALVPAGIQTNTWRLGIAGGAGTPNVVFPVDLATNTDYQVVVQWDPAGSFSAQMWVNPTSSSDSFVKATDQTATSAASTAFGFRQASSSGNFFCTISNLALATTFDEAATSVWKSDPVAPVIVYQPLGRTNFVGDSFGLGAVANGQGLAGLTYQWLKNGTTLVANPNGNSNVLGFASAATSDTGNYQLVVTTSYGLSATSSPAWLWVTNPPVPPTITLNPVSTAVYAGGTAVLKAGASGPPTISFQWYLNNNAIFDDGIHFAGTGTETLTVSDVQEGNGTLGTYRCDATNPYGTRSTTNAVLSIKFPTVTNIGYLRTQVDPTFYLPADTNALWTVTGIVTTYTNITSAANASFYMEDETGGINVFVGNSTDIRPQIGDSVTVTGPLGQFNSLLELNLNANNTTHKVVANSSGNLLPPGKVLPFSFTNGVAFGGVSNVIRAYQGAVITLTNVYFVDGFAGTNVFAGNTNYRMTNSAGESFPFRVDSRLTNNMIGLPIPSFAWQVRGPMSFFLGTTAPDRSAGFQLLPTRYEDVVTTAPAAVTGTITLAAGKPALTWVAEPYRSYSVYRAADINGPYLPAATGLTFNTAAGSYTDNSATGTTWFYKVASP